MSHSCSSALVRCIDFRLESAIQAFINSKKLTDDCDIISIAGAVKNLVDDKDGFLATQLDISKRLHNTIKIILMNHLDCGAYGGHSAFENIKKEREFHIEQMNKAQAIIKEKFPDICVETALACIDENHQIIVEEIMIQ